MHVGLRPIAWVLIAGLAIISPVSAQNPPAGSFGAGTAGVNGIPVGPGAGTGLNNSVNDPSGFGNAAKMPPLPSQATAPPIPGGGMTSGGAVRSRPATVSQISPRQLETLRGSRARAAIRDRDKLLKNGAVSICRGC